MDVLRIIKDRRKRLGVTQLDLAQMSGVSIATVKDMDRGQGNPSLDTLNRICDILGLEMQCNVKQTVI